MTSIGTSESMAAIALHGLEKSSLAMSKAMKGYLLARGLTQQVMMPLALQ